MFLFAVALLLTALVDSAKESVEVGHVLRAGQHHAITTTYPLKCLSNQQGHKTEGRTLHANGNEESNDRNLFSLYMVRGA